VVALGVIWGGTFMLVAVALRGYGPLTVAAARCVLGAVALTAAALVLRRPLPRIDGFLAGFLILLGLGNAGLPFLLLAWGQQHVPSAFAGLSMAILPLFLLPLAHVFVPGDRLTRRRAAGFGMGMAGAAAAIGPGVLDPGGELETLGRLACVGAAICYAVTSVMTRRAPAMDPLWLSASILIVSSVALVPPMLAVEGLPAPAAPLPTLALLAIGLLPTALAAWLRVRVIRSAGPSFMTMVNYMVPVWSVLFGALLLDEALGPSFFAALALILGGLAVSRGLGRGA
jgi:drug/metabolite transporter (DMT)-like permease